jgi:hypothetical protein
VCAVYEEFVIILMAFFCWRNILLMFVWDVQLYMLVQYSRWEWKKLMYRDLSALGVSVYLERR